MAVATSSPPEQGQLVSIRSRNWIVNEVQPSTLPPSGLRADLNGGHTLLTLSSIEDDGLGEEIQVLWELEPGARVIEKVALPDPTGFDSPDRLNAFLDAVRWGASSSADVRNIQSPFRSGIDIEDYQLDPVVRAIQMPRVNLLIADDVGLGKTIEAGMVKLELIIRHRARKMLIVCPSSLQIQWQEQMRDKFGLDYRIVNSQLMRELRRKRGIHVNPWNHFPRLITSIDFIKRERPLRLMREVLPGPNDPIYPRKFDLLTVMMRLVFLFCAEERELLLLGDELYDLNYAVSTLREQLRTTADNYGEEILERRNDAWSRLLTTFRAVYGGVQHDRIKLPAYGGSLFDPDRFPFLEGRQPKTKWKNTPSQPLPINNRTVLHLLEALQVLQVKLPGGGPAEPRKLSFRALGIEQIGHVYEGLLDHTAIRATEPVLGLSGTRDKEPEVPLSQLEELAAKGEKGLLEFLKKETGRSSVATIKKMLDAKLGDQSVNKFRTACHGDVGLWKRVEPFAGLVRMDTFGYPVVIVSGSVYVTAGTDRRSSGTHYTPPTLTEPIVQYTLEPLVYEGPAEGKPRGEWKLKSAAELLELKICDMACGSGAFLVQACRYMSEKLVKAWDLTVKDAEGTPRITPTGSISEGGPREQLIPTDTEERLAYARRIVAQRCLYGVDVNHLAAEMAKLSLWLLTLAKDKPFEFLDHAIRCGDSLVGLHDIEQLKHYSLKPDNADTPLFKGPLDKAVEEAIDLRLKLEKLPANTVADIEDQENLLNEAEDKIARLRCAADMLVATQFWGRNAAQRQEKMRDAIALSECYVESGSTTEFKAKSEEARQGQKMFHWPLEFPEVIVKQGGFDAFVGNPPFMSGLKLDGLYGPSGRNYLVDSLANGVRGVRGTADLCAYFFLRGITLLYNLGHLGLLATNTLAQGDTRQAGLDQICATGNIIYRAITSQPWSGDAALEVSTAWITRRKWQGTVVLDNEEVSGITAFLTPPGQLVGNPHRLMSNKSRAFQGSLPLGDGFLLTPSEAQSLLAKNDGNADVLFPFLNGEDLTTRPDQSASRWAINFKERSQGEAEAYSQCFEIVRDNVYPDRITKDAVRRQLLFPMSDN